MKSDRLSLISCFMSVAEQLSFVAAADALGITPSTVSRKVSRLEDSLGIRLLERTTRRVSLSEAGRLYYEQCSLALDSIAQAELALESLSSLPRGSMKISLPMALGRLHVAPLIIEFLDQYPDVQIEANYTDRFVNLIEEGYDLVLRTGELGDSSLVARRIASNRRVLVASPAYIEKHGQPDKPADLKDHRCVCFSHYSSSGHLWRFKQGDTIETVKVQGTFVSDNSEVVYEAALRGQGIGLIARYLCYDSIRKGDLVPLCTDWVNHPQVGIYVMFNGGKHLSPKVRAFADMLHERFKSPPWKSAGD